jgi:hypothetical protein
MKKLMNKFGFVAAFITAFAFVGALVALPTTANAADCNPTGTSNPLQAGVDCAKPSGAQTTLFGDNSIFQTVANLLIFIVGIIAVIMLIIGGIRYAVSGGDQGAVTSAKNTILYAIIGLVIAFLAFAAVNWVIGALVAGGSSS